MDVQNLRDNYPKLIAYMEEYSYSACYTQRVRREIYHILSGADSKNWVPYTDIYLEYAKKSSFRHYLRNKLTYLGIIESFDKRGQYPDGRRRQKVVKRGMYHLLSPEFKAVIDCYRAFSLMQALKTAAMSFLYEQLRRKMSSSPMKTDNTTASVTSRAARVAPQRCPILRVNKSIIIMHK